MVMGWGFDRLGASPFGESGFTAVLLLLTNFAGLRSLSRPTPTQPSTAVYAPPPLYLKGNRHSGEPIDVFSVNFYFPLQYYLRDGDCRLFQGSDGLHHYQGVPQLIPGDGFTAADIQALRGAVASGSFTRPTAGAPPAFPYQSSGCIGTRSLPGIVRFSRGGGCCGYDVPSG